MPYLIRNTNTGKNQLVWNRRDVKQYDKLPHYTFVGECDRLGNLVNGPDAAPNVNDKKDVWVEHASTLGIDTDGMTKDQVIAAINNA